MQIYCSQCGEFQEFNTPAQDEMVCCHRCDAILVDAKASNNHAALALTLSALILYFPANYYPIMSMTYMGRTTESTIVSGVLSLYQDGLYGLATLIFLVSFVVPLVKILALLYLLLLSKYVNGTMKKFNTKLLNFVHYIGPWSMLDVFLVAILVALVKLDDIARADPEPGVVAFAGVVLLTLIASKTFDSRLLWMDNNEQ